MIRSGDTWLRDFVVPITIQRHRHVRNNPFAKWIIVCSQNMLKSKFYFLPEAIKLYLSGKAHSKWLFYQILIAGVSDITLAVFNHRLATQIVYSV